MVPLNGQVKPIQGEGLSQAVCYLYAFYTFYKTESYLSFTNEDKSLLTKPGSDTKSIVKGKIGNKEMTLLEVKS